MRFLVSGIFWLLSSFAVAAESDLDLMNSMDQGREWGAVGRLSLDNGNGFCTATLIAHDIVLTAGHCVCLLYTSPSPRDRQKSRMPSSA